MTKEEADRRDRALLRWLGIDLKELKEQKKKKESAEARAKREVAAFWSDE